MGHPSSWRLHRAHPALGLEELDGECAFAPRAHELGVAWLALPPDERTRREQDFAAALKRAARAGSGWHLELVEQDGVCGVRMDRWKSPMLQRELLDHVWDAACHHEETMPQDLLAARRSGEPGRVVRAYMRIGASRLRERPVSTAATVLALAGVLGWHPLGWL